jgi:ATP-dependent Lon protease
MDQIYEDKTYREAAITPLVSKREVDRLDLMELQDELLVLVKKLAETNSNAPGDLLQFLEEMDEAEDFVDLVAYTFVEDVALKQKVLETLRIEKRFDLLIEEMS